MDICSSEYMFASELITNVMQLYSTKWEPDVKASFENESPFTPTLKKTIDYIWNEQKEFINDLFDTVLEFGTINMINYEVAVKFASHLLTEAEFDEIELLRYCVIVAGYATLFYQKGLKDVPNRCLDYIYNTIITFKSKNEFNDESWTDIELYGVAYSKRSQPAIKPCFVPLSKIDSADINSQDVCDQNSVKINNKNCLTNVIEEPLHPCRASTSKEGSSNLHKTKIVKRKRTMTKQEIINIEEDTDLNAETTTTAVQEDDVDCIITKELSARTKRRKKKVIHKNKATRIGGTTSRRSKKISKTLYKFTKNTGNKEPIEEIIDVENVTQCESENKNTVKIGPLAECTSKEVKSPTDKTTRHCDKAKCIVCAINKLKAVESPLKKVKDTKCKSTTFVSRKNRRKTVGMHISSIEKYADDKYTSEKATSNENTDVKITNDRPHVSTEYSNIACAKKKTTLEGISEIVTTESKEQENRPKTIKVINNKFNKNSIIKKNKRRLKEVVDCKLVPEECMTTKHDDKKLETVKEIGEINIGSVINPVDKNTIVNHADCTKKVSKSNYADETEPKLPTLKIQRMQNESSISMFSLAGSLQNATMKEMPVLFRNADQARNVGVSGMKVSKSNDAAKNERKKTYENVKSMRIKRMQIDPSILYGTPGTFRNTVNKAAASFTNKDKKIKEDYDLKYETKSLNESIDVCAANSIINDVNKNVAISEACKRISTKTKSENANNKFEDTTYENISKGREETEYRNTSEEVGSLSKIVTDKCVSETSTENNNEIKPIPNVRKVKLIKFRMRKLD